MGRRARVMWGVACAGLVALATSNVQGQKGAETFTATASITTAGKAAATAPVTITIDRVMPQGEADKFLGAFKSGGAAALRKSLAGVAPTGSVKVGNGAAITTRMTIERQTDKGRMLTMVTDQPIAFLGAGLPGAKAKDGYDFGIVDIVVDARGSGVGAVSPAAKVTVREGTFVVEDYASEPVRLTGVSKVK